jgi:hypothetical protein
MRKAEGDADTVQTSDRQISLEIAAEELWYITFLQKISRSSRGEELPVSCEFQLSICMLFSQPSDAKGNSQLIIS